MSDESAFRCPVCRAVQTLRETCRRCQADLRLVMRSAQAGVSAAPASGIAGCRRSPPRAESRRRTALAGAGPLTSQRQLLSAMSLALTIFNRPKGLCIGLRGSKSSLVRATT